MTDTIIRPARPDEAGLLSELALRSKSHWKYDQAFLDACRAELAVPPGACDGRRLFLAESGRTVVGFYRLSDPSEDDELQALFVDPSRIGAGDGRRLFEHASERARAMGMPGFRIESDPGAEPFYLRMGAERIGEVASGSIPGRVLPLLYFRLKDDPA